MANSSAEQCSTLLITSKREIKTTVSPHLRPLGMSFVRKTNSNKCWQRCGERIDMLVNCGLECKLVQPFQERAWGVLKELKLEP